MEDMIEVLMAFNHISRRQTDNDNANASNETRPKNKQTAVYKIQKNLD